MSVITPNKDTLVTVLAVVHEDSDILPAFVDDVTRVLSASYQYYEVLLIDNGADAATVACIREIQTRVGNIRCLRMSRRYDWETAIAAGLDNTIGDYVVLMEIESDPADAIPSMIQTALEGHGVVVGERSDRGDDPAFIRRLAPPLFRMASRALGVKLHPNAARFRVLSRQVVNAIGRIRNKSRYLNYLTLVVGYSQIYVPYERQYRRTPRRVRESPLRSLRKGADLVFSNSAAPLRMVSLVGMGASFLALLFVLYVFGVSLLKRHVAEGWVTTNFIASTMFFFLFLMLSVLSEYVARLLEETKEMPLYFTDSETNSSVSHTAVMENEQVNVV